MPDSIFQYGLLAALAIALLFAAFTDLRRRQIDNWLNGAIAAGAPLFWWASGISLWPGVAIQIGVAVAAFAVCALFFALRQMGGGDVKLLTALALWVDPINFVRLVMIMAIAGGVLTLVVLIKQRLEKEPGQPRVPYGVAISGAGLWIIAAQYAPAFAQTTAAAQ